jgi:hypothetical protein
MSVIHEGDNFTPEDRGDVLTEDQLKIDNPDGLMTLPPEFSPKFLAELAKLAPENKEAAVNAEAERLAAEKEAADKAEADRLAAEKLVEEAKDLEKKGFIPQGRFNEINEAKKTAEERAAATEAENKLLKEQLELAKKGELKPEVKVDPLEQMENQVVELDLIKQAALADYGFDSNEYREAVKQYNKGNRQLMQMEADVRAGNAVSGLKGENAALAAVKSELDEVAEAAYEVYPFLNKAAEGFDEEAINDVLELRNDLMDAKKADGSPKYTAGQALQKAIDKLAPGHALRIGAVTTPPDGETEAQKTVREAREKEQRDKAAAALKNQPAFIKGKTDDGGLKIDVNKMTPKEIADLPKELRDKLNGNELTDEEKRRAA